MCGEKLIFCLTPKSFQFRNPQNAFTFELGGKRPLETRIKSRGNFLSATVATIWKAPVKDADCAGVKARTDQTSYRCFPTGLSVSVRLAIQPFVC